MITFFLQLRRKEEKQEAVRMLRELRAVIAVRAEETREREERALSRRQETGSDVKPVTEDIDKSSCTVADPEVVLDVKSFEERNNDSLEGCMGDSIDENSECAEEEVAPVERLRSMQGFSFVSQVAMEAVAKSKQMQNVAEDTFGDH